MHNHVKVKIKKILNLEVLKFKKNTKIKKIIKALIIDKNAPADLLIIIA